MCELISNDNEAFFPGWGGKCEEQETGDGWHNSKNSEGEHKNISGYRAQAEMCAVGDEAEGGLMEECRLSPSTFTASWSVTKSRVMGPVMGPF